MKVRTLKRRFHARFYVDYIRREIWAGSLVWGGKIHWNVAGGHAFGTNLHNGKAPTLP